MMPTDPGVVPSSFWAPIIASISEQLQGPLHSPGNDHTEGEEGVTVTITASRVPFPAANVRERAGSLQGPDGGAGRGGGFLAPHKKSWGQILFV